MRAVWFPFSPSGEKGLTRDSDEPNRDRTCTAAALPPCSSGFARLSAEAVAVPGKSPLTHRELG